MECPYLDKKQKFCHAKGNFINPDKFVEFVCKSSIEFGHDPKRFETCCEVYRKVKGERAWSVS